MSEHPTNAPLVVVHPDKQGVSDAAGARLLLSLIHISEPTRPY